VDFVLYGENGLHAFEVKRGDRIRPGDLKSLNTFTQDYPVARAHYLYGGTDRYQEGKIQVQPISDFFKEAADILKL
jgi:hypothetical protein